MAPTASKDGAPISLDVPGAAGKVTLVGWKTTRPYVALDGERVRRGLWGSYDVPTAAHRSARVRVRGGMPGFIRVTQDNRVLVDTGRAPAWMWLLSVLPIILLLLLPGLVGVVIVGALFFANRAIVSAESLPMGARFALPILVVIAGAFLEISIYVAVYGTGTGA